MIELRVRELKTLKERGIGLITAEKAYPVLLRTRFGIHTLGMKFPLDVVVLDIQNRVVKLAENLKPNNFFLWNPKYNTVLELPVGMIKKNGIKLKSKVHFVSF